MCLNHNQSAPVITVVEVVIKQQHLKTTEEDEKVRL